MTVTTEAVLSLYRGVSPAARAHVGVRWATCPFRAVAAQAPAAGRVLEVGCGHGLLSALLAVGSPERTVRGIDVDSRKLGPAQLAAKAARERGFDLEIDLAPAGEVPAGPWEVIAIVDVLYLLTPQDQHSLLDQCARRLAPGGTMLLKEMAPLPRWKATWNRTQESLAVRMLGITAGEQMTFLPPSTFRAWMADDGLAVRELPLHRGYPHPHHLLVGKAEE